MPPAPDAVMRQWFEEVWNKGDEGAIDRLMAPGGTIHGLTGPGGPAMVGPAAFKPLFHTFREALSDLQIDVERTLVDGEFCTAFCRVKGRHAGQAFGGAPTGRPVEFCGICIARVRDGQLQDGWNVFDFLGMYQQIGWVANPIVPAAV